MAKVKSDKLKEFESVSYEEEKIEPKELGQVITDDMSEYGDLVISGRAIPSILDGMKPVQRRIFNSFKSLNKIGNFTKCAAIVGDVLGNTHPHGDQSIYSALIEMALPYKNRFTLFEKQGNFGSIENDSPAAMRYCVVGDTLINTKNGLKKISDLSNSKENETKDIEETILSLGNIENKAIKFFNSGFQDIYHLKTENGYEIKGSLNHPILVFTKNKFGEPIYKWKMLSNIEEEEYVVINRNSLENFYDKKETKKDKNKAIILGCLISEGSISDKRITFVNTDKSYFDDFISAWKNIFNENFYTNSRKLPSGKTIYEFDLQLNKNNKKIFKNKLLLELIGKKAKEKTIPTFILEHNLNIKSIFLKYLYEGEGSFSKTKKNSIILSYDSISKTLIHQIQILLLEFGIYSKIREDNRGINTSYKLDINTIRNQYIFKQKISFASKKKKIFEKEMERLKLHFEENINYSHSGDYIPYISEYIKSKKVSSKLKKMNIDRVEKIDKNFKKIKKELLKSDLFELFNNIYKNNFYYSKVKRVKKSEKKEIVYSIRVDSDCHSFVANGFINHNTEIKLPSENADLLFQNINKENVIPWKWNYADNLKEPGVLPVKYPLHLINGTFGIGYSTVTTRIPSYNMVELTKFYIYLIENKFWKDDFNVEDHKKEILKIISAPDMPTGTNIYFEKNQSAEDTIFNSKFSFRMRANYKIDEKHRQIIMENIPMETDAEKIKKEIQSAGLSFKTIDKKKIDKSPLEILNIEENADVNHVSTINDKSYLNDARIEISFKKNVDLNIELMKLLKFTSLDNGYVGKMMVIDENGRPVLKSLYEQTLTFLKFRLHTVFQAYLLDIKKLEEQLHLLKAFIKVLSDLDYFIKLVRNNEDEVIKEELRKKYNFDDLQIDYLLSIQIRKLSKTSITKLEEEVKDKETELKRLEELVSTEDNLYKDIKEDYQSILDKQKFKGKKFKRFSKIIKASKEINQEDLIQDKEVIIMYMEDDTIAYVDKNKFKLKNKGTKTTNNKINNDFELNLKITESSNIKDTLLLMTNLGKVFKIKTFMLSEEFRYIGNLLGKQFESNEKIVNILKYNEEDKYYAITTKLGKIKGVSKSLFKNTTSNRAIKSITLKGKDEVISFIPYQKETDKEKIIILTDQGRIIKYPTNEISVISGSGQGTKSCTLGNKENVLKSFIFIETKETVVVGVSDNGRVKKTLTSKISDKKRVNAPNLFYNNSEENGNLICGEVFSDLENEMLMLLTERADVSLVRLNGFNPVSRSTKGSVILLKMSEGEKIKICKKLKVSNLSETQNQILQTPTENI